jgi:3-hydroxyacyl-CoA dehydrogenase
MNATIGAGAARMPGRVAVIGTGVIGAGWAAFFLARGLDVAAFDPTPDSPVRLRRAIDEAWPALIRLGLDDAADPSRLRVATSIADAVDGAEFVQESGPEDAALKQALFAEVDAATHPSAPIASSSSGLTPSQIQEMCTVAPERVLVGHPFNPVHLIPLVEVVPSPRTDPAVTGRCIDFYRSLGKRPVHVRREVPGHLANRLQAALWREAYSLVERGVASVADIDTAIAHGPGLRWALLGPRRRWRYGTHAGASGSTEPGVDG